MEIVLSIIAIIFCFHLYGRVKNLEKMVAKKTSVISSESHAVEETRGGIEEGCVVEKEEIEVVKQTEEAPTSLELFLKWFSEDWSMKIGALILLVGLGWLVSYAFVNDWIGPIGRITFGLLFGAIVLVLGEWRTKKVLNQGIVLLGLGATIILLTVFAAREIYDFFTPISALILMFATVVLTAISSVKHKTLSLSVWLLVLAGIAPLLTNTSDPSMVGIFSYVLLLSAGTVWVVAITGWRVLTLLSLVIVALYSLPFMVMFPYLESEAIALGFAFAFAVLFYIANINAIIYSKKSKVVDLIVAGFNALVLLGWIGSLVDDEYKSFVVACVTLFFVLGAFLIFKIAKLKEPVLVYSGIAIVLLGVATAFELSGSALTIAYVLEVGVIALLASIFSKNAERGQYFGLLFAIPVLMTLESFEILSRSNILFTKEFFEIVVVAITILCLNIYLSNSRYLRAGKQAVRSLMVFYYVVSGVFAVALLWLSFHILIEDVNIARMIALIIYTLVGFYFYIRGNRKENRAAVIAGGIILGLVVLRLFFVEVWTMDLAGRVVTFLVVGALFIGAAFINKQSRVE